MTQMNEIVGDDVNIEPDAPEVAETAQAEAPAEQTPEPVDPVEEKHEQKTVPLAALHESRAREREARQRLEQALAQQAQRDALLQERLDALTKAQQAPEPTFEENPAEHLRSQIQQVRQLTEQQYRQQQEAAKVQAQREQVAQLTNVVTSVEQAFAQKAPDYYEAVNHLRTTRAAELEALGLDPDSASQRVHQELVQHAYMAAQQGLNPAEQAYRIALARGYQSKPAAPSAADKLQAQAKGVAASRTLGSGGATKQQLSLDALASMSAEESAEATKGNKWAQLMGG